MNEKNPLLVGMLNLIFPGLGAAYLGEWNRVASEFLGVVLFMFLWIFGAFLLGLLDDPQRLLNFNVGFIMLYALAMFLDGRQAAQTHNRNAHAK